MVIRELRRDDKQALPVCDWRLISTALPNHFSMIGRAPIAYAPRGLSPSPAQRQRPLAFNYEVENTTMTNAAQKRADISAANKKPNALSLIKSSSGNLHCHEKTIRDPKSFR
jgi:hypothetical protein